MIHVAQPIGGMFIANLPVASYCPAMAAHPGHPPRVQGVAQCPLEAITCVLTLCRDIQADPMKHLAEWQDRRAVEMSARYREWMQRRRAA